MFQFGCVICDQLCFSFFVCWYCCGGFVEVCIDFCQYVWVVICFVVEYYVVDVFEMLCDFIECCDIIVDYDFQ